MHSHTTTADAFSGGESQEHFRAWVILAGTLLLALGIAAVLYDGTATLASVLVFGWVLALAGAMQIVHAFQVRRWSGFFLYLVDGIFRATVGALLMLYPGSGALALTLVLSSYFIASGIFRAIVAFSLHYPSWGWTVASGVVSFVLGMMLAMQWPTSGLWFIGLAVGIELISSGWALLMLAAVAKQLFPSNAQEGRVRI
jgi:uncharacterized membrane protein HdeD (DUF308 family)